MALKVHLEFVFLFLFRCFLVLATGRYFISPPTLMLEDREWEGGAPPHTASSTGPPLERTTRHGAARHPSTLRLVDVDGVAMSAAAAYKTMSMDIVEGHQIGLYRDDGSVKYPHHHSLIGGEGSSSSAAHDPSSQRGAAGLVRRRPWSANPGGRPVSPEAVRDVMKNSDVEGAKPTYFYRARQESDNLTVSDLNQKRRSPSPRRLDTTTSPRRVDATPFDAYNAFHKHTSMYRPKDQSGVVPVGQKQRPWSAGVSGRAPHSDPLNPVYYVAASLTNTSPTKVARSSALVRELMDRNEQPSGGKRSSPTTRNAANVFVETSDATVADAIASGRIVVSRPIGGKAAPMTRKGAGAFKSHVEENRAKALMMEDTSSSTAVVWDKLKEVKPVNQRLNMTKDLSSQLRSKREAAAIAQQLVTDPFSPPIPLDSSSSRPSPNMDGAAAVVSPTSIYPTHLNPHMDHRDVPFATSGWKLRLLECRARRKVEQRSNEERQERDEAAALKQLNARPKYSAPPNCVDFGPSLCSTTTTHYTAFTKAHTDAVDDAATRGASPTRRAQVEPRRMAEGQHVGIEQCMDIYGAAADGGWKRPTTTSNLMQRIHRDVATAQQLSQTEGPHALLLTGTSSGRYTSPQERSRTAVRPSSATVRSAATGSIAADQRGQPSAGAGPHPPLSSSAVLSQSKKGKSDEISQYAAAMQRSGVTFSNTERGGAAGAAASAKVQRPQSANPDRSRAGALGSTVRPPPAHASDRKELRYRLEVSSVRNLPNFV